MREKSKVDFYVAVLLWGTVFFMLINMVVLPNKEVIGFAIGIAILCFILWIYFGTYYELRDVYLYCRCGPFVEKIPYNKIKSVRLSQNPLSSMALSVKRIEIRQHGKGYFRGTTFISPTNREAFLAELKNRCENIEQ